MLRKLRNVFAGEKPAEPEQPAEFISVGVAAQLAKAYGCFIEAMDSGNKRLAGYNAANLIAAQELAGIDLYEPAALYRIAQRGAQREFA